jgi:hypothetical protein
MAVFLGCSNNMPEAALSFRAPCILSPELSHLTDRIVSGTLGSSVVQSLGCFLLTDVLVVASYSADL